MYNNSAFFLVRKELVHLNFDIVHTQPLCTTTQFTPVRNGQFFSALKTLILFTLNPHVQQLNVQLFSFTKIGVYQCFYEQNTKMQQYICSFPTPQIWHEQPEKCNFLLVGKTDTLFVLYRCFTTVLRNSFAKLLRVTKLAQW